MTAFAGSVISLPYFALGPGQARETGALISVSEGETFSPEGEIFFTTVSVDATSVWEALAGWIDPDVEVVPEEEILGDQSRDENRQLNLEAMDISKQVAAEVAFEHLGFDVVSGTGAEITGVAEDLPVADHLVAGDTVVRAEGTSVEVSDHLVAVIRATAPGDVVRLRVEDSDGETRTERVEVAEHPDGSGAPLLGVGLQTRDLVTDFPVAVEIDTGEVGGPSAGLAFTLALLDVLTPGELTGGSAIAVTGTINGLGEVGPVGGAAQKAIAAERAGAELFLVPSREVEEAESLDPDLEVVAVDTLDEALEALDMQGGNALDLEYTAPE